MSKLLLLLCGLVVVVRGLPSPNQELVDPGDLALVLGEEEFEDYLDYWLSVQYSRNANFTADSAKRKGCMLRVNGDLGQPQPLYLHKGEFLKPLGNSGIIPLNTGDEIVIACIGSGRLIQHPNIVTSVSVATAKCLSGNLVTGLEWLNGNSAFGDLTCSSHSYHDAEYTGETCYNGVGRVIRVGFIVNNVFNVKYMSCFDANKLEVLYVWYPQYTEHAIHQSGVDRPSWLVGSFFPGVAVNTMYTQVQQWATFANLFGSELGEKYVTSVQFLSRGHLAAKSDFIFATGQRSSFWFINAAPQWEPFNSGNWNWLEQNLRARIGVAGYNTIIYTGTWGICSLKDANNNDVDLYLYYDANNNPQLPVPLYYYKIAYEPTLNLGTVFIGINNPHITEEEAEQLTFCQDRCRNNPDFSWIGWREDRIDLGYGFCCTVEDFQRVVDHLPPFNTNGLLV